MTIAGSIFRCIWGDLCAHILLRWRCEWELPGSMHWGREMPVPKFRSGVESFQCQCVGGGWGEIQQAKFRIGRERSRGPRFGDVGKWTDIPMPSFRWTKIFGPMISGVE